MGVRVAPLAATIPLPCDASLYGEVGGKGRQLSELLSCAKAMRLPRVGVPPALVIPASAFDAAAAAPDVRAALARGDDAGLEAARTALAAARIDDAVERDVAAFLRRHGRAAARSSASCEDGAAASFAGQFATRLNCATAAEALDGVREVWASTFAAGAAAYGGDLSKIRMAVVIQKQVLSEGAGVLFTSNPRNGHGGECRIEAVLGQGEGLVSGLVTPDVYWYDTLDPDRPRALAERISVKTAAIEAVAGGGVREAALDANRGKQRALSKTAVVKLCRAGARIAKFFAFAADVEFAVRGDRLWLLQCRRITKFLDGPPSVGPWRAPDGGEWERDSRAAGPEKGGPPHTDHTLRRDPSCSDSPLRETTARPKAS